MAYLFLIFALICLSVKDNCFVTVHITTPQFFGECPTGPASSALRWRWAVPF